MKSIFLSLVLLSIALSAFAQDVAAPKSSFDKFYDRLKISYFGAYQGSCLTDWERGACDEKGVKDPSYAHNLFNQVSFNYNFGAKFNLVINPRFTVYTGSTAGHDKTQLGMVVLEDPLVGFAGAWYSSPDKKLTLWTRFGARLPVSQTSRDRDITWQPEAFNIFSYDIDKTWQLGLYTQFRWWIYEQQYTNKRYRIFAAPYVLYTMNDTTKFQLFYEHYSEARNNPPAGTKHSKFQSYWSNAMAAVSLDLTPKVNFFPYVGYMLNTDYAIKEQPADPLWVGFWLSYQIK
jgi:hypothetical protein